MKKRDFWITYGDRNDKPIEPCQFHTAGDGLHLNVFHSPVVTVTEGWSGCQALDIQVRRGSPLVQVSVALRGVLEKAVAPHSSTLAMDGGAWWAIVHGVTKSWTRLSDFPFTFQFHALEKEMGTHSSVLAWRIRGMGEPGGLLSMGSRRVRHD